MNYCHEIKVAGSGCFPVDMLRYNQCWPATSEDCSAIIDTFEPGKLEHYRINLKHYDHKSWEPTKDRWLSFGWRVVSHRVYKM